MLKKTEEIKKIIIKKNTIDLYLRLNFRINRDKKIKNSQSINAARSPDKTIVTVPIAANKINNLEKIFLLNKK